MMELTKDRLQKIVHAAGLEPCDYEEVFDGITTGEIVTMARQLLAGMERDPVAYIAKYESGAIHGTCDRDDPVKMEWLKRGMVVSPLYAAPQLPQPAVAITQHFDTIALDTAKEVMCDVSRRHEFLGGDVQLLSRIQCRIDEACRSAMLQGSEPVSQRDELPLDYLQGQKDGLEWAARLAEASHPQTSDWLYDDPLELAKAIRKGPDMPESAGNSPVIPDGYAPVQVELLESLRSSAHFEKASYAASFGSHIDTGRWKDEYEELEKVCTEIDQIIAAAPKHEVK